MKKVKRILAAAGAILLLLLYASTLVCALSSSENFMNLLMVSIYATVIIPVLLWAYTIHGHFHVRSQKTKICGDDVQPLIVSFMDQMAHVRMAIRHDPINTVSI